MNVYRLVLVYTHAEDCVEHVCEQTNTSEKAGYT